MSYFEVKQCPYCGRWCHPQLVVAKFNIVAPKVTTYEVVYPCVCNKMPRYYLKPTSTTNADEVGK